MSLSTALAIAATILALLLAANIIDRFRNPVRLYIYLTSGHLVKTNVVRAELKSNGVVWTARARARQRILVLRDDVYSAVIFKDRRLNVFVP